MARWVDDIRIERLAETVEAVFIIASSQHHHIIVRFRITTMTQSLQPEVSLSCLIFESIVAVCFSGQNI